MMLQTEHSTETLPPEADDTEASEMVVQGRFGELKFGPQNLLRLPNGLLGFSSHHNFGLANFPNQEFGRFKSCNAWKIRSFLSWSCRWNRNRTSSMHAILM